MASVLIIEDDGLIARQMSRALHDAGHTPVLAPDGRSALQELGDRPDVVVLDLGLPDLPGERLLTYLKSRPETEHTPVLVITGRRETVAKLRAPEGSVSDILLKPVSAAQLCRAVNVALAGQHALDTEAQRVIQQRQRDLIQRILVKGSDLLAFQVCLRLSTDRISDGCPVAEEAVTWAEIVERATREGLLNTEQASLLRCIPLTRPPRLRQGSA
jgi:DNA-binding response OmpR family regulator